MINNDERENQQLLNKEDGSNPNKVGNMTYIFNKKRVRSDWINSGGVLLTVIFITLPSVIYYIFV